MNRRNWLKGLFAAAIAAATGLKLRSNSDLPDYGWITFCQDRRSWTWYYPGNADWTRSLIRYSSLVYYTHPDGRIYVSKCRNTEAGRFVTIGELNLLLADLNLSPIPDWSSRDAMVDSLKANIRYRMDIGNRPDCLPIDIHISKSDLAVLDGWDRSDRKLLEEIKNGSRKQFLGLNIHYPATVSRFCNS